MKCLYLLLALTAIVSPVFSETPNTINLTEDNHMVIRGTVTGESVSRWILELNKIQDKDIIIYINSPGGSVLAGMTFVEQIKQMEASGKNVKCVADIAASMAFIIFQACPERYTTTSSILMQHQMSLRLGGSIENVKSYLDFLNNIENDLNTMQANKLDMPVEDFTRKIAHDWWLSGSNIMKYKAADSMVHVHCHDSLLQKVHQERIDTIFGRIILKFSKCPLSRDPIGQDFRGITDPSIIDDLKSKYIPSQALKSLIKRNYNEDNLGY